MASSADQQEDAGQAVYTPAVLAVYDLWVLGLSNRWIWKCPTARLLELYNRHASDHHLDVGVGTGYYLAECRFPGQSPRITLVDLNPNSLRWAAKRIKRYSPTVVQANVLERLELRNSPFSSIGLMYVLHCLPGTMTEKAIALANLKPHLLKGGTLFGATILQGDVPCSSAARRLMVRYNKSGIFSNTSDTLAGLRQSLEGHFESVNIEVVGCVGLFSAK